MYLHEENNIDNYTNIPLKAQLIKHTLTDKYTIELQKYGNKHRGFTIVLTDQQVERIKWWY